MGAMRDLLRVSRPISWVNTALPFLAAAYGTSGQLTGPVLLGTLAFLFPYNLLLYGVNDVFDYESDVRNPRKGSAEGGLVPPERARRTWLAIALAVVPTFGLLAWLGGPGTAAALLVTLVVAVIYSAPPLRTKERPVLDSLTSALHFVLPAVCGLLVAGGSLAAAPLGLLVAFIAWGMASHALGAIQDIGSDRAAGIASVATAAGARLTAAGALTGYALAVVLVAAEGGLGLIAAAVLALYLLLPAAVLAHPDDVAAARRAWRAFLGLNYLAGFAVTQLLLWHWGVTDTDPWLLAIGVTAGSAGWTLVNAALTVVATRRSAGVAHGHRPAVTVVVPCRDEAARLPRTLAALVATIGPRDRVLLVDDGSTDGSMQIARAALAPLADRALVVPAGPAPDGWTGKAWACRVGVDAVETDLVLFLDADTSLEARAIDLLVAQQAATDADFVTGVTRYDTPTTGERIAVPGLPMLLFGFVPVWLAGTRLARRIGFGFGYGPVMLVRRDAYLASGGHSDAPSSAREDLELARTFVRAGFVARAVHATDLASTRHYDTPAAASAAWRRILLPYAGGSLAVALAAIAGQLLAFGAPVALPLLALATAQPGTVVGASLLPLAALAAFRALLAAHGATDWRSVLLHPLTVLATLSAEALAIADWVRGTPPAWRGRPLPSPTARAVPLQETL